jgi:hypothetical protein
MVNEQKIAKLIQMMECMRRDNPFVENHVDPEALAMPQPADPSDHAACHERNDRRSADEYGAVTR